MRASPLNISALLADFTPNTHTWSRLKAALSVHRKGIFNTQTPLNFNLSLSCWGLSRFFTFSVFFSFPLLSAAHTKEFTSVRFSWEDRSNGHQPGSFCHTLAEAAPQTPSVASVQWFSGTTNSTQHTEHICNYEEVIRDALSCHFIKYTWPKLMQSNTAVLQ